MRKLFAFLVTSADGYDEGPNGEFDWPLVDDEFNEFGVAQLDEADTLVFGRRTYEGMAAYWPTIGEGDDLEVAARMNGYPKIVVSRTLDRADWHGTRIIRDDVAGELTKLKAEPGKDITILGSSDLTVSLIRMGLVDEVRIMVNPIVLGAGRSVFHTAGGRIGLTLLRTRQFRSGNVLLVYRPSAG